MFRFFTQKNWFIWSWIGSAIILSSLWIQVKIDVKINEWFGEFYDMIQKALGAPNSITIEEYWASLISFITLAAMYVGVAVVVSFFTSHYLFRWRTAMVEWYHSVYDKARKIEGAAQRVQEDTIKFSRIMESLGTSLIEALMILVEFMPILFGLSIGIPIFFFGDWDYGLIVGALIWSVGGTIFLIKKSIYLLPEINRKEIKKYNIISCPGCYPTSILLPLFPLFKKNLIKLNNIIIDSKSGYSGAGRGVHKKYKHKNLYESLSAYGVGFHRHNSEIDQMLRKFTKKKFQFSFTPHLSPMFRGILSTIYVDLENNISQTKALKTLISFYKNESFVKILKSGTLLSTNDVINTNNCYISVCKSKYRNKIIILSAIDNLIKGGAGQAVQNLNNKFNFPEKTGLK